MLLKKAGSNWVDGDRFYNRDVELESLAERAFDGTHTLITAPRRMGKTSLVREFLRRAKLSGNYETIFVDLEDSSDASDAIAELAAQSRKSRSSWERIKSGFSRLISGLSGNIDSLGLTESRAISGADQCRESTGSAGYREPGNLPAASLPCAASRSTIL